MILGTAAYMSPEQARGQAVDKRTDIWAFGCVLYEMLTGRLAFHGGTLSDTIAAILDRAPDWRALPQKTPAGVQRLLQRCLAKDSNRRLHDIADARIELDDAGTGSLEEQAIGSTTSARHASRRLVWMIAAASTTALVAALVVGNVLYLRRAPTDTHAYRSSILPPEGISLGLPRLGLIGTPVLVNPGFWRTILTSIPWTGRQTDGSFCLRSQLPRLDWIFGSCRFSATESRVRSCKRNSTKSVHSPQTADGLRTRRTGKCT